MLGFLFGEGTDTPSAQELARKRAIINQLMARDLQPQTFASGVRQFGGALAGRFGDRRLDPKEDAERERSAAEFARIAAMLGQPMSAPPMAFGGSAPVAPAQPAQPPVQGAPVPPVTTSPLPPSDLPPQIAAAVDRVAPPMAQGGGQGQLTEAGISSMNVGTPEDIAAVTSAPMSAGTAPQVANVTSAAFPASLIETESGGNWGALNNVPGAGGHTGHGGRLQFGTARLQEAANAGVVPPMTAQEFARQPPEVQMAVENWHFSDIDNFIRQNGFDQLIGQEINGTPITIDGMRAVAHLGGKGGLARFIETRGGYNPADANGTSLANYFARHGNGGSLSPGGMSETMSSMGTSAPSGGNMAIVMQLAELMGNPYLPEGQRMVAQMLIQQQMGSMFAQPEPGFRMLSPQDAQAMGLPEGTYQQGPDGRIMPIGAAQTVINNNIPDPTAAQYTQPITPAQEAIDKAFADTYVEWTQGGGADAVAQLAKIESVADQLESGASLTGTVIGNMPDVIGSVVNPAAVNARENVEEVVQRNLKLILGGAFTEKEAEAFIARAYNPRLPEAQNAARLRVLTAVMRSALEAKQSQVAYYEQNGTLMGWQGNIPSLDQMAAAIDNAVPGEPEDDDGGDTVLRWNPATNSFDQVQQ